MALNLNYEIVKYKVTAVVKSPRVSARRLVMCNVRSTRSNYSA